MYSHLSWIFFRPSIHLPVNIVLALAEVARFFREKFLLCKTSNPFVTASTLRSFTSTRTFDCSNAERVIGYSPVVSLKVHISFLFVCWHWTNNYFYRQEFSCDWTIILFLDISDGIFCSKALICIIQYFHESLFDLVMCFLLLRMLIAMLIMSVSSLWCLLNEMVFYMLCENLLHKILGFFFYFSRMALH